MCDDWLDINTEEEMKILFEDSIRKLGHYWQEIGSLWENKTVFMKKMNAL